MGKPLDLTGQIFGRLFVVSRAENRIMPNGESKRAWNCICDCGNEVVVTTNDLRSGDTRSCGCLKRDLSRAALLQHGDHGTHLHRVWCAMKRRCTDHNQSDYCHYGGRGISVCDEWLDDYTAFKDWALSTGYAPDLTIDRIDVDKDYSPSNCRWVTMKVQCNNRSNNRRIEYDGVSRTISEWASITGIPYSTLYMRIYNGWEPAKALTTQLT